MSADGSKKQWSDIRKMKYNICGNCDYCDKTRMRCIAKHEAVKETDTCEHYFNIKKTEIYNLILNVFGALKEGN